MQKYAPIIKKIVQFPIFQSRWILLIFYCGLIIAQLIYCIKFVQTLVVMVEHAWSLSLSDVLLSLLELVDMVMIGNLIKMIVIGSYQSFIEKLDADHSEHVSSGILKIKIATSLVMISSINLLQPFINTAGSSLRDIAIKVMLHLVFLCSALTLGLIEYLHDLTENNKKSQ